jgi:NAD(P)-dependent dehydrogenase (short-subunit alcohol dehydrogenase family)
VRTVLVVGGTGPTGYAVVRRLLAAGDRVTIVHTGAHEVDFGAAVEHVHTDPTSLDDLRAALGSRSRRPGGCVTWSPCCPGGSAGSSR